MEKYKYYERNINYYETDKMGVVHHSNYARYLEECRVSMMEYYDMPLEKIEEMGYMIPVLELHESFCESVKFGETIRIIPKITKVTNMRFYISYEIYDETMTRLVHKAETVHCFLDSGFRPVCMKKTEPELYDKFISVSEE